MSKSPPLILIGLTGGIASGKSTVAKLLKKAGGKLIDADKLYHQLLKPRAGQPSPLTRKIVKYLRSAIPEGQLLTPHGSLRRPRLAALIFNDPEKRQLLEQLTHPAIAKAARQELQHLKTTLRQPTLVFLEAALLYESKELLTQHLPLVGTILVTCPKTLQVRRLSARNHLATKEALARIHAQMPLAAKKKLATWILNNHQSLAHTQQQVQRLWAHLQQLYLKPSLQKPYRR